MRRRLVSCRRWFLRRGCVIRESFHSWVCDDLGFVESGTDEFSCSIMFPVDLALWVYLKSTKYQAPKLIGDEERTREKD